MTQRVANLASIQRAPLFIAAAGAFLSAVIGAVAHWSDPIVMILILAAVVCVVIAAIGRIFDYLKLGDLELKYGGSESELAEARREIAEMRTAELRRLLDEALASLTHTKKMLDLEVGSNQRLTRSMQEEYDEVSRAWDLRRRGQPDFDLEQQIDEREYLQNWEPDPDMMDD